MLKYLQSVMTQAEFRHFFIVAASTAAGVVFLAVVGLTWMGVVAPWSGRLVSKQLMGVVHFYLVDIICTMCTRIEVIRVSDSSVGESWYRRP